ncbi:502c8c01-8684-4511-a6e1-48e108f730d4 [Sclerotinia trifoliorum]|uniref:502c8c01-8684-4511-a6e1-48e108f730d4 n=1 Tax=Sclerotinia trifoliorum TaxID=28548 RepID=A0A8H2ZQB2_9HELO|nr:502c8c01-8684-4511-a6e1-48e108f730d4 [Sclerotinia trifoliorum]
MSAFTSRTEVSYLFESYDWSGLESATIVDVGGGYGPISISLATKFPALNFIVQDLPGAIADGPAYVPADISDHISFMAYDMFTPQTIRNIDVIFFRAVFHNWTDHYCVKILRNQIPALKKGSRLLIVEPLLVESGKLPWHEERRLRTMNLNMLSYFGSREKSMEDWRDIFRDADERFEVKNAVKLGDSLTSLLEVLWKGE